MPSSRPRKPRVSKKAKKAPPSLQGEFPRHNMVPVHELLSAEEGNRVLEMYRTPPDRMPKILREDPGLLTDPAFRAALEAKEDITGRVVRIRRNSQTAGEALSYRIITGESTD